MNRVLLVYYEASTKKKKRKKEIKTRKHRTFFFCYCFNVRQKLSVPEADISLLFSKWQSASKILEFSKIGHFYKKKKITKKLASLCIKLKNETFPAVIQRKKKWLFFFFPNNNMPFQVWQFNSIILLCSFMIQQFLLFYNCDISTRYKNVFIQKNADSSYYSFFFTDMP